MPDRNALMPYIAVTVGIAAFSGMDVAMKGASIAVGVYTAMFLRSVLGTAIMLPIWLWRDRRMPASAVMRIHLLRACVITALALLFFYGLVRIPIAEAIAISFIAPLIALYFAAVFLGETISSRAIFASLLGLAGVVVIAAARFGEGRIDPEVASGIAAILVSAVFYALNLVLQRKQAQMAGPIEVAFTQNVLISLILAIAAPWFFQMPDSGAICMIALGAVLASVAVLLLSWGYAREETQALVPLEYTAFLWASLFGWLVFDERVGIETVAGAVLIVIGCSMAARRRTQQTAV